MNLFCVIFDAINSVIFFFIGFIFYKAKEKAAPFISAEIPENCNKNRLCESYGKRMMIWSIPFSIGIIADCFIAPIGCIVAWAIWFILLSWHLYDMIKNFYKFKK